MRLGNKTEKGVKANGTHRVKIISDKIIRKPDPQTGKDTEWVRYVVEEKGEQKIYDTRLKNKDTGELSYLVQRFAEINEGDEVILEMKKQGIKNYIEITPVGHSSEALVEDDEEDEEDYFEKMRKESETINDSDIPF